MQWRNYVLPLWFALITLISAFLVFQVQPVISKTVLPWFGGSPAVWTTCMLFFQVILFAGYAYAHVLTTYFAPQRQGCIHFVLLVSALLTLPITPGDEWKPEGGGNPTWQILLILGANVGLPYFLLSSTGPLMQAWFRGACAHRSPYRLYALSNVGSLAALLSYPILVEPAMTTTTQGLTWSAGFCLFAALCACLAARWWGDPNGEVAGISAAEVDATPRPAMRLQLAWVILPAIASIMLLATTNHVCQDIAVIPFLWVAPLTLYLLTFIICFDREHWYSRRWLAGAAVVFILTINGLVSVNQILSLGPEVTLYLVTMFLVCMVCHGELVRCKPSPRYLTKFYLLSSAGGALGGIFVALLCPLLFPFYFELNLCLIAGVALSMGVVCYELQNGLLLRPQRRFVAVLAYFGVFVIVGCVQTDQVKGNPVVARRNFYGTLRVAFNRIGDSAGLALLNGRILHGFQFLDPEKSLMPTTYFSSDSGVGLTLQHMGEGRSLRVGAVGLGVGTVAAYGRPGDYYRFYEINPSIVDVAEQTFGYLSRCQAKVDIQLGDARVSLEREAPQRFDVLILDAFSGDSIPTHLLTQEAFAVYRQHLNDDGVIALHISNRHLQLEPVVLSQAARLRMKCVRVINRPDPERAVQMSKWMLLTNNSEFLARTEIQSASRTFAQQSGERFPIWTDQRNNVFQILNIF